METEGWYGIVVNGILEAVQYFKRKPLIWDFHLGFVSTDNEYDVVEVSVTVVKKCARLT